MVEKIDFFERMEAPIKPSTEPLVIWPTKTVPISGTIASLLANMAITSVRRLVSRMLPDNIVLIGGH